MGNANHSKSLGKGRDASAISGASDEEACLACCIPGVLMDGCAWACALNDEAPTGSAGPSWTLCPPSRKSPRQGPRKVAPFSQEFAQPLRTPSGPNHREA